MIKRILLALGGTPFSHVAVRRGIELAQAHGASLVAVTILDTRYWQGDLGSFVSASHVAHIAETRLWAAAQQRVDKVVAEFERACAAARVAFETQRPAEQPFDELTKLWRYCDLVVFGLRGLFDYNLVPEPESTIADLIRKGVRPILAVSSEYRPVRRVLVAYSGSTESAKAMKQFVQLRLWPQAQMNIACFGLKPAESDRLLADASSYCQSHGLNPQIEAVEAPARSELLPYARAMDADLIVMGDSFRHVLLRDLLGDTMSNLIRGADRPLFLSH